MEGRKQNPLSGCLLREAACRLLYVRATICNSQMLPGSQFSSPTFFLGLHNCECCPMSHRKIKGSWHSFSLSKWKVHFLHISSLLDLAIFHNKFNFFHSGEFAVILFSIQFNLKYAFYQINPTSLQILRPTR